MANENPTPVVTPTIDKLGEWLAKYGISTVLLLAFAYMFVWPLVQSHQDYLRENVQAVKQLQTEVRELKEAVRASQAERE